MTTFTYIYIHIVHLHSDKKLLKNICWCTALKQKSNSIYFWNKFCILSMIFGNFKKCEYSIYPQLCSIATSITMTTLAQHCSSILVSSIFGTLFWGKEINPIFVFPDHKAVSILPSITAFLNILPSAMDFCVPMNFNVGPCGFLTLHVFICYLIFLIFQTFLYVTISHNLNM